MSPRKGPKLKKKITRKPKSSGEPPYLSELKSLIELVTVTGVSELEVQSAGRVFRIGRGTRTLPAEFAPAPMAPATSAGPAAKLPPAAESNYVPVKSPIVGTFYRAPAPDADPYIEEGQRVSIGQTVCIIEAMKLLNEIQSEVSGRIVRILVQNTQPVEYGQELFLVDPGS